MSSSTWVACILGMSLGSTVARADFDGSVPLACTAAQAHDCLPEEEQCRRFNPAADKPVVFEINFAGNEVRSPFRTAPLQVLQLANNGEAIVLQGVDLQFAWSALIRKATGAFTISIADREGAYVAFGKCSAARKG